MPRHTTSLPALLLAAGLGLGGSATSASAQPLAIEHVQRRAGPPVVAVVAEGRAVLSDFMVPYGVLATSGAAKVVAVNIRTGPIEAGPLSVTPDMSAAEFDRAYPDGADYVIVPATQDKHAAELGWLKAQRAHGAALISICDGVELLAEIGALDGRRATGHWASLPSRRKSFRKVAWVTNQRYVVDGDVASSSGVSASLPISLALLERIAGEAAARSTAARLGVSSWSPAHDSDLFSVRGDDRRTHISNMHKPKEVIALQLQDGDDPVAVSLHAEAWSRTMRDDVRPVSASGGVVRLSGGLQVATQPAGAVTPDLKVTMRDAGPPARALPADLDAIAGRYGTGTARLAALGMEFPWGDLKPAP